MTETGDVKVGIVGLGVMGLGIAQVFAAAGHPVVVTDAYPPARETAAARLRAALTPRVAFGKMTAGVRDALLARVSVAPSVAGLAGCAMVIEAIAENIAAKQALFAGLEAVLAPDAVLATNTSSLSVAAIASGLKHPDRLLGLHFFNPAPAMRLVELVAAPATSVVALALARDLTEAAGKQVVTCADRPGFIVNRCARPFYGEALAMLEEGVRPQAVDAAMRAAGYRLGPFALIDLIGADINLAASEGLATAMANHPRYHVFQALRDQVQRGNLGRKTGSGFVTGQPDDPTTGADDSIVLRIEATLANEAATLLAEGGVTAEATDKALRLGLNFPRGPFESARRWGLPRIRAELIRLERRAPEHLKTRYTISPALGAMI